MNSLILYIKDSYNELVNHVTWPTWEELFESSRLVIVGSVIFSLIILLMDSIANGVLGAIYDMNF